MDLVLGPLSFLYGKVTSFRNRLYDQGIFKSHSCELPVVSVGNLTMGGTGKTPIIEHLLNWAKTNGLKPALVTRGYAGRVKGVQKMTAPVDPNFFGDEPTMLHRRFPSLPIYVGADRVEAVRKINREENIDLGFADDAFQHRRLRRNVDIVVVDCMESQKNYKTLPLGRARESLDSIQRSNFLLLNKVNLVSADRRTKILEFLTNHMVRKEIPIIEVEYNIARFTNLDSGKSWNPTLQESVLAASGIGNPRGFEKLLRESLEVSKHMIFDDHYRYKKRDIESLVSSADKLGVQKIVVTEKDAVKISSLNLHLDRFWSMDLILRFSPKVEELYGYIFNQVK